MTPSTDADGSTERPRADPPEWWLNARVEPRSWEPRAPLPDMPQQPPHTPLGGD